MRRDKAREVIRLRRQGFLAGREGFTTWSNYKLSKLTRDEGRVDRQEYRARHDRLKVAWDAAGDVSDVSDDSVDVSAVYREKIDTKLWGCSFPSEPLRCDCLQKVLDEFASARLCTRAPPTLGLTVRLEALRTSFFA